jgi:hypothetical protein
MRSSSIYPETGAGYRAVTQRALFPVSTCHLLNGTAGNKRVLLPSPGALNDPNLALPGALNEPKFVLPLPLTRARRAKNPGAKRFDADASVDFAGLASEAAL